MVFFLTFSSFSEPTTGRFELPKWADVVKTSKAKELPPSDARPVVWTPLALKVHGNPVEIWWNLDISWKYTTCLCHWNVYSVVICRSMMVYVIYLKYHDTLHVLKRPIGFVVIIKVSCRHWFGSVNGPETYAGAYVGKSNGGVLQVFPCLGKLQSAYFAATTAYSQEWTRCIGENLQDDACEYDTVG